MVVGSADLFKIFTDSAVDEKLEDLLRDVQHIKHACTFSSLRENKASLLLIVQHWKEFTNKVLISSNENQTLQRLIEMTEKEDLKFFVIECIVSTLEKQKDNFDQSAVIVQNVFDVLTKISCPKVDLAQCSTFYSLEEPNGLKSILNLKKLKSLYSTAWIEFIKLKLPPVIHQQCLKLIPIEIMPHVREPILFTDFFYNSYNIGPPYNILALNGIFVLIVKHNLDYPEFFKQIYGLLTPNVFQLENRDEFFTLLDTFLSSLHVPAYLVAAFVKRLARLALDAPPDLILILLTLIKNWTRRHANLGGLANKITPVEVSDDPFIMDQDDPAASRAIESSLWEVKTLQSHYLINVARKATFVDKEFELVEDPLVQKSMDTLTNQHMSKTFNDEVPVAFVPPTSLFRTPLFDECFVE